jgi:limonene-1,2-epoxide hydrolase
VTTPTSDPATVVRAFLADLERLDLDAACAHLAPDVVYVNVSLPPARGIAATRRVLGLLTARATGFRAENHRLVADGPVVLTERTDTIEIGRLRTSFWVCGNLRGARRRDHALARLLRLGRRHRGARHGRRARRALAGARPLTAHQVPEAIRITT